MQIITISLLSFGAVLLDDFVYFLIECFVENVFILTNMISAIFLLQYYFAYVCKVIIHCLQVIMSTIVRVLKVCGAPVA